MNLASVDGTIGPAAEARIPATDEGLLRGDGVFEVMRLYEGRPFALERRTWPASAPRRGNLRLDVDIEAVRAELARAARGGRPGRRPAARGRHARRAPRAVRRAAARAHLPAIRARLRHLRAHARPRRRQVAVLRGQHARHAAGAGARVRRGAAGHAARPRARGPDLVASSGPATASCSRRRSSDHILDSITRRAVVEAHRGARKPRARARSSRRPTRRSSPRRSGRSSLSSRSRTWTWPQGRSRRRRRGGCGSGSTPTCAPTPPSRAGGRREDRPGS